jgi:hypothetical protein
MHHIIAPPASQLKVGGEKAKKKHRERRWQKKEEKNKS